MKTCSSIFLIPYLIQDRAKAVELGFINGYIRDLEREQDYINPVFAVFKPNDLGLFEEFLKREKISTRHLVDDYDFQDYTVLVYEFPLTRDYELFLEGKYSQMSDRYKTVVSSKILIDGKEEPRLCWRICNKTKDMKEYWETKLEIEFTDDQEYYSKPDLNNETLDYSKIILNV